MSHVTVCVFALGDGGSVREPVCTSGLHLVCVGTADLSHSADTTVKRMPSKRPGIVDPLLKEPHFCVHSCVLYDSYHVYLYCSLLTKRSLFSVSQIRWTTLPTSCLGCE